MLDKKIKLVLAIIAIPVLWLLSGLIKKSELPEKNSLTSQKIIPQSKESHASLKEKFLVITATVKAKNYIKIAAEMTGLIKEKLVEEGDKVKEGDLLFTIENQPLLARKQTAESDLLAAKIKYDSITTLFQKGLASKLQLEEVKSLLNTAQANLATTQEALNNSRIKAPFSGIIDEIFVSKGDLVTNNPGNKNILAKIVNLDEDEIIAHISSKERALLQGKGQEVLVIKDQNNSIPAKIGFISQSADEATGTYTIKIFAKNSLNLLDGETVTMKIKLGEMMAHKVPLSALIIDSSGDLAIRRLEVDKVITEKIQVLEEEEAALWITGIPEKSNIILVGHYYAEDR